MSKAVVLEAFLAGASVVGGMLALGWLHETPFPTVGKVISHSHLTDVTFYVPPLGAIAIMVFNASSLPPLYNSVVGIMGSTIGAWALVWFFGPEPVMVTRALVCGFAFLIMKLTGAMYPAAGALAVIFVDNAKLRSELGIFYCLMPGLSGTAVLLLLGALKIELLHQLKPFIKRLDTKGEVTKPVLPQGRASLPLTAIPGQLYAAMGKATYAQALDDVFTAYFVVFTVVALGYLDSVPMPGLGGLISYFHLADVKFYAPPLAAITTLTMAAPSLPPLKNIIVGILSSTACACLLVSQLGGGWVTRALACGSSMFVMKLAGAVYPPAGALAALFVDNAKMQSELGIFYCLMPGLSGTAVVVILAAFKIKWIELLGSPGSAIEQLVKRRNDSSKESGDKKAPQSGEQRGRPTEKNSSDVVRRRNDTPPVRQTASGRSAATGASVHDET